MLVQSVESHRSKLRPDPIHVRAEAPLMPSDRCMPIETRLRIPERLILLAHTQATEEDEGVEEVPIINIRDTCKNPDFVDYEL